MHYDTDEPGMSHEDRVKCAVVLVREFNKAMEDLGARVFMHNDRVALLDVDDARIAE